MTRNDERRTGDIAPSLPADATIRIGNQLDQYMRDQEAGICDKTIGDYIAQTGLKDIQDIEAARKVFEVTQLALSLRPK